MSDAVRLRVLVDPPDGDARRRLAAYAEVVQAPPADVAVLMIVVEGGDEDALDRAAAVRDRVQAPVVVIVDGPLRPRLARTLAAHVGGVVESSQLERALEPTLRAVAAGQAVFPASFHRMLQRPPLSNREKQILGMVVLGCSNAEIADKLVVTESTIKNHLSSVFAKLGVRSRSAATKLVLDPETGLGLGVLRLSQHHEYDALIGADDR
jgi:DNA-binding NarL/FixJ family response regulator